MRYHLSSHGVGEIHGQDSDVDVLDRLRLRGIFLVPGHVAPSPPEGNDIAIALALRVEGFAAFPLMHPVIGRQASIFNSLAISHNYAAGWLQPWSAVLCCPVEAKL